MRNLTIATLFLFSLTACDCGGGPNTEAKGELSAGDKKTYEFAAACPKPSDPKYEVTFETQNVVIRNVGKATSYLNKFEVDAASKDVFVVDTAKVPKSIDQGQSVEIPVTFKPNQSGTITAKLHVAGDLEDGKDTFDISLLGEGKSFDPLPMFSASCQSPNTLTPTVDGCTPASSSVPRTIRFMATPAGGYVDVPVTVKNAGCPNLTLSNVKVATTSSDDSKDGFSLAPDQQTSLTVAGGNGTAVVTVRFSPVTAGSIYKGALTFDTNDPDSADASVTIKLDGEGTSAALWLDKTMCDFTKLTGPCDGKIQIRNSGGKDLTVTKVSLEKLNGLFTLVNGDAFAGLVVPKAGSLSTLVEITYNPDGNPLCPTTMAECSDNLVVESDSGTVKAVLQGGSPAVLKSTPASAVDFNASSGGDPLDHNDHYETLKLTNVATYNQQLDLTLKDLVLDDSRKAFSVVTSGTLPPACGAAAKAFTKDTVVKSGESFTACLKFTSDVVGGTFNANLNVLSTDPSFPDPAGLLLQLNAKATCEAKPTAAIEVRAQGTPAACPCSEGSGCPATSTCGVVLPDPPATSGSVDVSGESSFSPTFKFDQTGQCVEDQRITTGLSYEWKLVSPADGSASILPDGKTTAGVTTLTFSKAVPHIISLKVTDSKSMVSNATQFTVNVSVP